MSGWYGPPAPQHKIDAATIAAMSERIRVLEGELDNAAKRQQAALDFVWRELTPLIDEPSMTRRRLRRELWVILLKAGAGHAMHFKG